MHKVEYQILESRTSIAAFYFTYRRHYMKFGERFIRINKKR
ncbi:hypothetical protein SAMN05443246_4046 [Paenibacillus sp. GP183]|nr:hypothetical protein SAMN05443246_4046 [Paenibacillus sp. GP183]